MPVWRVEESQSVDPYPGTDREYAHAFRLRSAEGADVRTTVEFARGAAGSAGLADAALARYLNLREPPPGRILVFSDGSTAPIDHEDGAE